MPEQSALLEQMEFPFSDSDFEQLSLLITKRTGIELPSHKKALVYGRLARRLRALGLKDFTSYIKMMDDKIKQGNEEELITAIQAVTTNVTSFFRESHHFDVLREALPKMLAEHGEVRIWSSACSTGEEPWSIAMVVAEFCKNNPDAKVSILASDIDNAAIAKAQKGSYTLRPEELKVHPLMGKYLKDTGPARMPHERTYSIDQNLRPYVQFKQLNLIEDWRLPKAAHIVFCRNVIIYFGRETKTGIFERMNRSMVSGGLLCIGHSETLLGISSAYKLIGRTTYQKV